MTKLSTKINAEIVFEYLNSIGADGSQAALNGKIHVALMNLDENTSHQVYAAQLDISAIATNLDLTALTDNFGNTIFATGVKFLYLYKPLPADTETITLNYNGVNITLGDGEIFMISSAAVLKQLLTTPTLSFTGSGDTKLNIILIGS